MQASGDNAKPFVQGGMHVLASDRPARRDSQVNETGQTTSVDIATQNDRSFAGHLVLVEITPAGHRRGTVLQVSERGLAHDEIALVHHTRGERLGLDQFQRHVLRDRR